jgi:hypothetical protein
MLARLTGLGDTGIAVVDEAIARELAAASALPPPPPTPTGTVPLSRCPWYTRPEIGETDLVCQFPSTAVLLLGAAGIGVLIFLSVRS